MSEAISNDARPKKVTSIGNSWIVCKSKSHPGHIYYFNTLTGVPCWNLSDDEMERARQKTKQLGPGAKPTNCPEPKEKPPSTLLNNSVLPQSLSTEQFVRISEKQSVLTYSNVANNNATFSMPINQIPRQMQGTQISNTSSLDPSSLNSYYLNTTPTVYNPNVWDVPHAQQVFITPGLPSIVNHSQGPLNVAFNHLSSTLPQPATGFVLNSFENASQSEINTTGTRTFYPRDFNIGFTNKNDLRQKLSMKRRLSKKSYIPGGSGMLNSNSRNAAHIANKFEGIHLNDSKTGLESRCIENQFQFNETPSKINLDPLKSLAPSDSKSDAWFIVVDLEVLLHEFKFLTTLTDSDEKCHLMVPKRVMEELKKYVTVTENIQAKRILRFLSQQIEIGYAFTADAEGDDMAEAIHETCKELSDNKYYLVLLTNDTEVLTQCPSNINKFHVEEIKNLLMLNSNEPMVSSGPKKPFMSDELINKIKITVPNNVPQKIDTISPVRDIKKNDHIENISKTPHKQNNTPDKTEKCISSKQTVDAGIQTDLEDINASISLTNVVERRVNVDSNVTSQNLKEATTSHSVPILDKKREIKLNRSTSHQPQGNSVESLKKQFKWRRRRNTSLQCQIDERIQPFNDQMLCTNANNPELIETNTLDKEISKLPDRTFNNTPLLRRGENKITDDSIESTESSIYAEPRNSTSKGNITIEETSTSGIISNTESNVDADSNYSNSNNSVNQYNGQSNKPMYEVDSITMEQYLRMKCDEWISRFIQIMEEVLSQVLLQDPPFTHSAMPPPWTLHEAAQCVALKFRGHQGIMAAASQLSTVLFQVSDPKGKITMNMSPYQYMQMYSYGAHLLAALMEVATSCEDIQIAVESLDKLLHDIRNPNMDSSTTDTFSDNKQVNTSNSDVQADNSDVPDNNEDGSLHEQEIIPDVNQSEEALKDKPKEGKSSEEELQRPVKFIRNLDIPFSYFDTLRNTSSTDKSPIQTSEKQCLTHSHIGEQIIPQNVNQNAEKGTDSDLPANQPNIIRKFSTCRKYEEKLKMNCDLKRFNDYGDEELDYDESYDEYVQEDYCPEDDNHDDQCHNANGNQTDEKASTTKDGQPNSLKDVTLLRDENNEKFKFMVGTLLQEITKALSQVQILCEECYTEFKKPKQSTKLKCQLQKQAETAHLKTLRLYRSLERMLETADSTQNMSDLLEQADIDIHHVEAELLVKYRISVDDFKNITDDFLKALKNIIFKTNR